MENFYALCAITWYCDANNTEEKEYIVLTGINNYTDAMCKIERYYANDLISVDIALYEGPFILSEEMFKELKNEER
jgi:hypothetical protein